MNPEGGLPSATKQSHRGRYSTPHNQRIGNHDWWKSSPNETSIMSQSPAREAQKANEGLAKACSLGWRTLALAFQETTQQWVMGLLGGTQSAALSEATRWLGADRERFAGALEMFGDFVTEQQIRDIDDVVREIKVEYDRLFTGAAGPMEAPPYESAYRDPDAAEPPMVKGPSTLAVEKFYRRHTTEPAFPRGNRPDHIATELEFMYFLTRQEGQAWEKGEAKTAEALRRAQLRFVEEHLARWLPDFCGRVQNTTQSDLYFALANILREFLTVETRTAYGGRVP